MNYCMNSKTTLRCLRFDFIIRNKLFFFNETTTSMLSSKVLVFKRPEGFKMLHFRNNFLTATCEGVSLDEKNLKNFYILLDF